MQEILLIGAVARKTGLTRDTVRFYERLGLISAGERLAGTRVYKTFAPDALERLEFIKQAQAIGFTLREVKDIFDAWGTNIDAVPHDELIRFVEAKLRRTEEKLAHLESVRIYLSDKLERLRREGVG